MRIAKWKNANLENLCAVWFQLYDVLDQAKLRRLKRSGVARLLCGGGGEGSVRGEMNRQTTKDF